MNDKGYFDLDDDSYGVSLGLATESSNVVAYARTY